MNKRAIKGLTKLNNSQSAKVNSSNSSSYSARQLYTIKTFGKKAMLGPNKMVIHVGCMGCGKTRSLVEAFGIYCADLYSRGYTGLNFILLGITQGAVKRNMCNVLSNLFGSDFRYDKSLIDGIQKDATLFGQNLYIIGLSDTTAETRIRGISTIAGILHDEAVFCTADQFGKLISRLRGEYDIDLPNEYVMGWYIGSTNPDSPEHFIKKLIDNGEIRCIQWYASDTKWKGFKEYFRRQMRLYRYDRANWDRFIRGLWSTSDNVVYPMWRPKLHVFSRAKGQTIDIKSFRRVFISADYGSNHPTAILLIGCTWTGQYVVCKEYRYTRTAASTIVYHICGIIDYIMRERGEEKVTVYVDPSAVALKDELRKNNIEPTDAKNSHIAGIGYIQSLLVDNKLLVDSECENTIHEMGSYSYKPNSNAEEVIKLGDDFCDALRYGVYTDNCQNNYK